MIQYNDYELLYLMSEFDEEAERILYEKYTNLIYKRINSFKIKSRYRDDFLQEGYYALYIAINSYDIYSKKTFNKFFDMLLQRRFIRLLQKDSKYFYNVELCEEIYFLEEEASFQYNDELIVDDLLLSKMEKDILDMLRRNYSPKDISMELNIPTKSVYNCICRIKFKLNK